MIEGTPNYIFRQKKAEAKKKEAPSNVVTGLGMGTQLMLENVFSAVTGVITEPVKGAKSGGILGGAKGLGKGMLGLVCKPVKGTIDLVTQTTRGITNTPRTMYVAISKMVKKVPQAKNKDNIDLEDDILIGEENGE